MLCVRASPRLPRSSDRGTTCATDARSVSRPHVWIALLMTSVVLVVGACGFDSGGSGGAEAELLKNLRSSAEFHGTPRPTDATCTQSEVPGRVDRRLGAVYDCDIDYDDGVRTHYCYGPPNDQGLGVIAPGKTCKTVAASWAAIGHSG